MPLSYVYRGTCRFCSTPLERVLAYRWDGGYDCFSVDCDTDDCDKRESIVDLVGVRRGDDGTLVPKHLFDDLGDDPSDDDFELLVADLLPDDDDGEEEPGEMYRRAFAKAEANVASRRTAS